MAGTVKVCVSVKLPDGVVHTVEQDHPWPLVAYYDGGLPGLILDVAYSASEATAPIWTDEALPECCRN